MNVSYTNLTLPCLHPSTDSRKEKQRLSCSTNSRSGHSSSLSCSTRSKSTNSISILIQLCMYSHEDYAYQTMKAILSSQRYCSPNACDEFGCNVLMYTLRYQRYKLFALLLSETSIDLNLRVKDQQGNSILHYAVIYGGDGTIIVETLIQSFLKFGIDIDTRNIFGFTPLLLAVFCGRYDVALTLLTKTDASPFVRDYIQSKNLLDYVEMDTKDKYHTNKLQDSNQLSLWSSRSREYTRLRIEIYKTLPHRSESSCQITQTHPNKNFFENIFSQAAQDRSALIRSPILKMLNRKSLSSELKRLTQYLSDRYPHLVIHTTAVNSPNSTISTEKTPKPTIITPMTPTTLTTASATKLSSRRETSKTNVHHIFNLFDPDLRPKAKLAQTIVPEHPKPLMSNTKAPTTFKRIGTKLTVVAMVSRSEITNRASGTKQ